MVGRAGGGGGGGARPPGALERAFTQLYGDLPAAERLRVAWLAGTLFFIIGGYWLLRSLKDPIVATIVGVEYIPRCKMVSLVVVFALVFVYNKLLDVFPKHRLFYIVGGFYALAFGVISALLADPVVGLANTKADPTRLLGWVSYCAIESFGSICVSLFWAFVNSTMNFEGAKSAYGLIIAGAQVGSILGPSIAATYATTIGVARLYGLGALAMALMVAMVWGYVRRFGVPASLAKPAGGAGGAGAGADGKGKGAGVLEGFHLFMRYAYVRGIFALSCLFMVEVTILDYTMKVLAKGTFDARYPGDATASSQHFAAFMGFFGQVTNGISFAFSLLGTSMVIRRLGLRRTLLAFPSLCVCVVLAVMAAPRLETVFLAMITLKAFSYSLNNPCKEMLYAPTSTAVKFKSKSWIDIFGARGAKAAGSVVTNAFADSAAHLVRYGGGAAVCVSAFLVWVAHYMGARFEALQESGEIVGGAEDGALPQTFAPLGDASDDEDDDGGGLGSDAEGGGERRRRRRDGGESGDEDEERGGVGGGGSDGGVEMTPVAESAASRRVDV
ncbi:hypothetical protein JKP88DRAFT_269750 [Tribonema minus]|uniref:ADP,ATP carrier protein n=1 Tax=Tribonema minus TaxID=303371 RepID=A0A835YYY6_9STRA|nr:hypothetical protein JKP88DRAFT_269750 [Tribonema minus]